MGIETFFFISLAVTFLLLVALVYHFHQKFVTLDQRVNNVIEIINSVVKEMQNLKHQQRECFPAPAPPAPPTPGHYSAENEYINIPADSFIQTNVSLGNFSEIPTDNIHISNDDDYDDDEDDYDDEDEDDEEDDEDDDEDDEEDEKIVVSDDEDNVVLENIVEISIEQREDANVVVKEDLENSSIHIISNTDYKKMDISQLRAVANSKGIDAKKMKKSELLKLLEQ